MNNQIPIPTLSCKVLARCFTYNQSKYIEEALNGFAIQCTNFPYVCMVVDDCSTDGEQEVIKAWMESECEMSRAKHADIELSDIVLVPHKSNNNCTFVFYFLKRNLNRDKAAKFELVRPWRETCKYEALCEGDDYWIHPQKLQMQADTLDNNPQCTICINKVRKVDASGKSLNSTFPEKKAQFTQGTISTDKYIKEEFYNGRWNFQISGCMFRIPNLMIAAERKITVFSKYPFGDIPMILSHFLDGNGYYIDKEMSCYRVMSGGYNSEMCANPEKAIANQERVKAAMNDIDEYTNHKYHKAFVRNMLWCDLHIANMKFHASSKNKVNLVKLTPHFWPLLTIRDFYGWGVLFLNRVMPKTFVSFIHNQKHK